MLARCYRCQGTFSTDRFGVQKCPSCGAEIYLPEPGAPPASGSGEPKPAPEQPAPPPEAPQPPRPGTPTGGGAPPPTPPLGGGGWGAPPPGWRPPAAPGWGQVPPGAVPPVAEQSAPFAERARLGLLSSFAQTWRLTAVEPARFFRQVRVDQASSAVLFGVIAMTIGNWVSLVVSYATASATMGYWVQFTRRMGGRFDTLPLIQMMQGFTLGSFILQAIVSPLLALAGVYVIAGVFHLFLLLVRAAPRRFDATLTVAGYACGIFLLRALPVCGGLLGTIWFAVVAIQGLAEAQRCGHGKAAFAVLMPLVALCLVACGAGMIAALVVGTGAGGGPAPSTGL